MTHARDKTTVQGILARVLYRHPDSDWTVGKLAPDDNPDGTPVTVVGVMVGISEGMPVRVRGAWVDDPKYGRQLAVDSVQSVQPETLVGLERYLGSGLIPGIGPELAKRVVAEFGLATLDVIESDPKKLRQVDGIGAKLAGKIADAWHSQREVHDVMVFLRGHGISTAYASRIYKKYGTKAVKVITDNPYVLALEVHGIGFKTADGIARSLGTAPTAPERLQAGLIHSLRVFGDDGHVHAPEDALIARAAGLLEVDAGMLGDQLAELEESALIVREPLGDRGWCASLRGVWWQENRAAAAFADIASTPMRPIQIDVTAAIAAFEAAAGLALAPPQRRAVEAAIIDKCVVITGGPGVGKTTIVRAIVDIFEADRRVVALAAPTGRAAKRLSESTGADATTLHRLLEFQPRLGGFQRDARNPLSADAVIVDEASMLDIALFRSLLDAVPPAAQLVLVGDVDQLPSVGPGAVLADVIASGAATVVRLTDIFRQASESRIITAAHQVNRGELPALEPPPGNEPRRSDFYFVSREDPVRAADTVIELVADRIPEAFGFDRMLDIQVVCPMHRGDLGTLALNRGLQARLNPPRDDRAEAVRGDRVFRAGDKVMQIVNDYDKSVFNGDIGLIRGVFDDGSKLLVDYADGRSVPYESRDLDQLIHAYAVSVHKSQGSEYPAVVIPLATQHFVMLQRNLLYTAITRGKSLVVIVGSARAVALATRNDATNTRWTWLAERIRRSAGLDVGDVDDGGGDDDDDDHHHPEHDDDIPEHDDDDDDEYDADDDDEYDADDDD